MTSAARSLLRERSFCWLAAGQAISRLGDGLYTAAVAWLAWSLEHTPAAVALVMVAANLPALAATVVGGSYADRYDRRRLMIATDAARAGLVAAAAALAAVGVLSLVGLIVMAAIIALAGAPFAPARNALVPDLVPAGRLLQANGLLQVSFRAAYFVGPLLLSPLLTVAPLPAVLALDAGTFVISAVSLTRVVTRPGPARTRLGLWADLVEGFAALRDRPDVLVVIATFVSALVMASGFLSVGVIALVGRGLGGGAGQYGLLLGISGICEVAGALVIARLRLRRLAVTAVLAWVLLGVFRFPLGFARTPLEAALLLAVTGFASALTDIPLIALVQAAIPRRHLAKALGLWEAGVSGGVALSPFIAAFVIAHVGVRAGFMLSGGTLTGLGVAAAAVLTRVGWAGTGPRAADFLQRHRSSPASAGEGPFRAPGSLPAPGTQVPATEVLTDEELA